MVDIAECLTAQIAKMDMKSWSISIGKYEVPSAKLSLFFKGLIEGLEMYEDNSAACFANESQKLARDALFLVLSNLAFHHPDINLADGFKRLPPGADTSTAAEKDGPLADKVFSIPRVPRGRQAQL